MKKILYWILLALDLVGTLILNWIAGLFLWIIITFLSFLSFLIGGKNALMTFYAEYKNGINKT